MRILNTISDTSLTDVILYLTLNEALELRDSLEELLQQPLNNHSHVMDIESDKEITICIYDPNDLQDLDERSIRLIEQNQ